MKNSSNKNLLISLLIAVFAFAYFHYSQQKSSVEIPKTNSEIVKETKSSEPIKPKQIEKQKPQQKEFQAKAPPKPIQNSSKQAPKQINPDSEQQIRAEEFLGDQDQSLELPEDLKRQLEEPPPELPEDMRRQLEEPIAIPEELKDQLPTGLELDVPKEIPEDIQRALENKPRYATEEEVNGIKAN